MNLRYEHRTVYLEMDGKKVGECRINDAFSVSIHIDEEYQGLGYSRLMWRKMFKHHDFCLDQLFFVDADASNGYWGHIGFVPNRYGYDYKGNRDLIGRGYEKVITFRKFKLI